MDAKAIAMLLRIIACVQFVARVRDEHRFHHRIWRMVWQFSFQTSILLSEFYVHRRSSCSKKHIVSEVSLVVVIGNFDAALWKTRDS